MKKEDRIVIRIFTAVASLALLALILAFGAGSSLFSGIVQDINYNVVDPDSAGASIYNLYFYRGLSVLYRILFSAALFSAVAAAAGLLVRFAGAVALGRAASVSGMLAGAYIVLAALFEKNVALHRFVDSFYIDDVPGMIETVRMIGVIPVVSGILLIVLGAFSLFLIQAGGFSKMKAFHAADPVKSACCLLPVLYGSIICETFLRQLAGFCCESLGGRNQQAQVFIRDYYFADAWGFNIPYAWYLSAAAVLIIVLRPVINSALGEKKRLLPQLAGAAFLLLAGLRSLIFFMNPPRLFGYLTLDESLCDLTEAAYPLYMAVFALEIVLLAVWEAQLLWQRNAAKKTALLMAAHLAACTAAVLVGQAAGITGIYGAYAAANVLLLAVTCFVIQRASNG